MSEKKEKKKNTEALEDLKNISLVLGGVVIGNLIDLGAQKILKLNDNVTLTGINKIKKFISPTVRIAGGAAGAYLGKSKTVRMLSGGVAISGVGSVVGKGMDKILNKGSQSSDSTAIEGVGDTDNEALDQYREEMVVEDYNPKLPELHIEDTPPEDESEQIQIIRGNIGTADETDFDEAEIL